MTEIPVLSPFYFLQMHSRRLAIACLNLAYTPPLGAFLAIFCNPWHSWEAILYILAATLVCLVFSMRGMVAATSSHSRLRAGAGRLLKEPSPARPCVSRIQLGLFSGYFAFACINLLAGGWGLWRLYSYLCYSSDLSRDAMFGGAMTMIILIISSVILALSWLPGSVAWAIATGRDAWLAWELRRRQAARL